MFFFFFTHLLPFPPQTNFTYLNHELMCRCKNRLVRANRCANLCLTVFSHLLSSSTHPTTCSILTVRSGGGRLSKGGRWPAEPSSIRFWDSAASLLYFQVRLKDIVFSGLRPDPDFSPGSVWVSGHQKPPSTSSYVVRCFASSKETDLAAAIALHVFIWWFVWPE